ncbi:MAG: tetratricopeptide repeat protein [Pseudomonadota bacterium]
MSDIFREVEEDLRQERVKRFWRRYGWIVGGAALVVVLGVAGYRLYDWYQTRQAALAGDAFFEAVEFARVGDHQAAADAFGALADRGGRMETLARFRAASARASAGDLEGAIADYDAVAADPDAEELIRQAAAIRAAYLLIDTASAEEIGARIGDQTEEGSAFRNAAHEVIGANAYRLGDLAAARAAYAELASDFGAPADMRQRAERMLDHLAARGVETAPRTEDTQTEESQ